MRSLERRLDRAGGNHHAPPAHLCASPPAGATFTTGILHLTISGAKTVGDSLVYLGAYNQSVPLSWDGACGDLWVTMIGIPRHYAQYTIEASQAATP